MNALACWDLGPADGSSTNASGLPADGALAGGVLLVWACSTTSLDHSEAANPSLKGSSSSSWMQDLAVCFQQTRGIRMSRGDLHLS